MPGRETSSGRRNRRNELSSRVAGYNGQELSDAYAQQQEEVEVEQQTGPGIVSTRRTCITCGHEMEPKEFVSPVGHVMKWHCDMKACIANLQADKERLTGELGEAREALDVRLRQLRMARLSTKRSGEEWHAYLAHDGSWWHCPAPSCVEMMDFYRSLEASAATPPQPQQPHAQKRGVQWVLGQLVCFGCGKSGGIYESMPIFRCCLCGWEGDYKELCKLREQQPQQAEERGPACPQCGSLEGMDGSWRYVDGSYQHKCPKDPPQLGHYRIQEEDWPKRDAVTDIGHERVGE